MCGPFHMERDGYKDVFQVHIGLLYVLQFKG
jgi:hypothetical protein